MQMKRLNSFALQFVFSVCCLLPVSAQENVFSPTLLLSNTATGLSLEQQATRIQIFRILNPVIRNGKLEVSNDTPCVISGLDLEPYFEYARQYCHLYNSLQKNLAAVTENGILSEEVTPIGMQVLMDYVERDSCGLFVLGISKEDAVKTGILPGQYEQIESEIRTNNRSLAKWMAEGSVFTKKDLKNTMISALGIRVEPMSGDDPKVLRVYHDFEKAFVELNRNFE